jgi:cephalosporin hydroxylase
MSERDPVAAFLAENQKNISEMGRDRTLQDLSLAWNVASAKYGYSYHFAALGRPIIQLPQDMVAVQELIWQLRPDLIIETGIAHGGSLVMSAAMLALIDYCDAVTAGEALDPLASRRRVLGVDIDIRSHNRLAIEQHPMAHKIELIQGSSIDEAVVDQVRAMAGQYSSVLVMLDSNHTRDHVLAELEAYGPMTTVGGYCIVFDTVIDDLPTDMFPDRPWGEGNNPKTAVREFLDCIEREGRRGIDGRALTFEIDHDIENKLLISVAPNGYLRRT